MGGWKNRSGLALSAILALIWLGSAEAMAQDLNAELAAAQAKEAEAQAAIAAARPRVAEAEREFKPIAAKERRARARAARAVSRAEEIEEQLVAEREAAADEIARLEAAHAAEDEDHDDAVAAGWGAALGLLALLAIPLAWSRFRQLDVVERLAGLSNARAFAWVLGVAFVLLLIAAALAGGDGAARVLGAALVVLVLGLAVALLWARHSLLVEREQQRPLWTRERLPRWATLLAALLLVLLGVGAIGSGPLAEEPEALAISPELRTLAKAAEGDPAKPATDALKRAAQQAEPLLAAAQRLQALREQAEDAVTEARRQLTAAERALRDAERAITTLTRQIEEEAEQAALAAARAARQAERQAARAAAQSVPAPSSSGGGVGYANCDEAPDNIPVPPGSDLDADGDGIGCET